MSEPRPEEDPRVRSARTTRTRTRAALIAAADAAFSTRGWTGVRVEDIATAAGVSAATAYNHFPTKHTLIAAVYAPHVRALLVQANNDLARGRPVLDALTDQIHALVRLGHQHRGLTAAFTAAALDYTIRVGRVADPDDNADPRTLVPLRDALQLLIQRGQAGGELRGYPPAAEISGSIINLWLIRSLYRADDTPSVTSRLLLTLLFGAVCPDHREKITNPTTDPPGARARQPLSDADGDAPATASIDARRARRRRRASDDEPRRGRADASHGR